jgi:broad specificity phosphatase PhoE
MVSGDRHHTAIDGSRCRSEIKSSRARAAGPIRQDDGVDIRWDRVFLARHGQTEWNLQRRRQGQLDSPLTAGGVEQALRHAADLRSHAIDAIFASPLGRARATADIIGGHLGLPVVAIDELTEVHHGSFAGLTDEEINSRHPDSWRRRSTDKYRWSFPDGESYADADVRAGHALARIGIHPARRPLVVSHEMIGRMLRRHLLGLDPDEALAGVQPHDVIYSIDPRGW